MNAIMRGVGLARNLGPKFARGIGQAASVSRQIGQAARDARQIGQAVNTSLGGRFDNNRLYNKAMQVAGQVEQGAEKANRIAQAVERQF